MTWAGTFYVHVDSKQADNGLTAHSWYNISKHDLNYRQYRRITHVQSSMAFVS
jgi:hypothetical protein